MRKFAFVSLGFMVAAAFSVAISADNIKLAFALVLGAWSAAFLGLLAVGED